MSEPQAAINAKIREFIISNFPLVRQQGVGDGDSLFESGIVDSMGILEIVTFLEDEFGIEVTDDEMVGDVFESIASLGQLVERRNSELQTEA